MKPILDVCCGSRMFWFNKQNPDVLFADIRKENHILCDGRILNIEPDIQIDFRDIPFDDESFFMVVFDPPHLLKAGQNSWLAKKYGVLSENWREDIKAGFYECWRVLKKNGTLIFKWSEDQIGVADVLKLFDIQPLFGHRRGKTIFLVWMKI